MFSFLDEYRNVQKLISTKYDLIFYAENGYYFQYFKHLVESFAGTSLKICYLTSDKKDPIFNKNYGSVETIYCKTTLAFVFKKLQAKVVILTMPDLQNFIFKKSDQVKKYIYVFHALVSIHQQYRSHAFDHYDTIFCAGPHHQLEIRESETLYKLPSKDLVSYGYPLLHDLNCRQNVEGKNCQRVLIAPSWYEQGIFQTCIEKLIEVLSTSKYEVIIRPHPEYLKRNKSSFKKLKATVEQFPNLFFDQNQFMLESMRSADLLITDRSGIAFEFAFTKKRQVLFINTPPKRQNEEVGKFKHVPVENLYREKIGQILEVNQIELVPFTLNEIMQADERIISQIMLVKESMVYDYSYFEQGIAYIRQQIG